MSEPLPCEAQLLASEACIDADSTFGDGICTCVPVPFRETFSSELEGAFQRTLAFYSPDEGEEFCNAANNNVCEFLDENASCCCQAEITSYAACLYGTVFTEKFQVTESCSHSCTFGGDNGGNGGGLSGIFGFNGDDGEGGSGGTIIFFGILLTIIGIILSILYYCFCSTTRRKRKRKITRIQKETTASKSDDKNNNNGSILVNVNCSSNQEKIEHSNTSSLNSQMHQPDTNNTRKKSRRRLIKDDQSKTDHSVDTEDIFAGMDESVTRGTNDLFADLNIEDDDEDDDDIETGRKKRRKKKNKKYEEEESILTEPSTESTSSRHTNKKKKKDRRDNSSSDDDDETYEERKRRRRKEKKKKKKKAKSASDSEEEDSEDDDNGTRKSKSSRKERRKRSKSRKYSSSDEDSKDRRRRNRSRSRSSDYSESSSRGDDEGQYDRRSKMKKQGSSRSVEELRQKRRDIEHWYEKEKQSSKRSLYSDDDDDKSDDWVNSTISTKETPKKSSSRSKKNGKKREMALPDKVEYSIRKARTILEDDTKAKVTNKKALEKVHVAMYTDINELVRVLEEDRRKMEFRIKEAQEESARLRMENKSTAEQIDTLEETKAERETRLLKAKTNMGIVRSGSSAKLSDTELQNKSISKEIDSMRREKEEMAMMLARLSETKAQLESQLIKTEVENTKLQSDVDTTGRKLIELETEKSKIEQKVHGVNSELQAHQKQAQQLVSSWDDDNNNSCIRPKKSTALGTIPSQASIHFGHDEESDEDLMKERIAELAAQKRTLETQLEAAEVDGGNVVDFCEAVANGQSSPPVAANQDQGGDNKPPLNSWLNFDFEPQRGDDDDSTFGFISLSSKGNSLKSAKKPLKRIAHS